MSSQTKYYRPRIGMRFELRGSEFEVCFAESGIVRYASVKGGKPYRITFQQFLDYQKNEISIINADLHGQDEINGNPSFSNLTDKELGRTMRRIRYAEAAVAELIYPNSIRHLDAWVPGFAKQIKDCDPPPSRTVSSWVQKYILEGNDAFMAPERKRGNNSLRFSPEIEMLTLEAVDTFIQEENRDGTDVLAYIAGSLAEKNLLTKDGSKIKIPSLRTIRRHLNRIDPYLLVRIKKGVIAAEKMARAAGKMITSPRPLYLVEIDTHFLEVFVVDPDTGDVLGKPYLACAIDVRTRCVVGTFVSLFPASTTTTLGVIKDMLSRPGHGLPGGVPIFIIPDNGVEFKNSGVGRVFVKLHVNFEPAEVRDPNDKPHVESFFRTLSLFLIQKIKGTTFSNLEKRGDYDSETKAYATLEQIEGYIRDWVENEYHMRPHSSTGRIPIRMWEEETAKAKPLAMTKDDVDVLARRPYRCRINDGRVKVEKLSYYSHALKTLEGLHKDRVTVLANELGLEYVYVEHPYEKGTLIKADSVDPEYTQGLTMWEHKEAQLIKAQMTQKDIQAVGKYANLLARYHLLQKLQQDSAFARKKIAQLTQGIGRTSKNGSKQFDYEDATILPSVVEQPMDPGRPAYMAGMGQSVKDDAREEPGVGIQNETQNEKISGETLPAMKIFKLE